MNIFDERIKTLQDRMRRDGLRAYIIPATDPHMSESYCDRYGAMRKYFCPFRGQDGTLLVTLDSYEIYTDGRYWIEAEKELEGSSCLLVKDGHPGVKNLFDRVKDEDLYPLGIDTAMCSIDDLRRYYAGKDKPIYSIDYSFLVKDLPSLPKEKIFRVDPALLSTSLDERVSLLLEDARKAGAESLVLTALDDIAYVLGYRGRDIPYTPVFYSYLFLSEGGKVDLFIDPDKIPADFDTDRIIVHPYESIFSFLKERTEKVLVDPKRTNARIYGAVKNKVLSLSPAYLRKAVKGPREIENTLRIHEIDGIAVLRLMKFLEDNLPERDIDELEAASYLDGVRLRGEGCYDLSFETIAAVDSNGPMMHYAPTAESHSLFTKDSLTLLVDSGGQYYGGTTDITRTFLAKPTEEVIHDYTLTLKSQISLSRQIFMRGCTGHSIDIAAREVMWREGLDYKCGTGHGVSYMGPVHEGPIGFRYYDSPQRDDKGILLPGHVITIEPGVYKEGKYGIRLENELLVKEHGVTDQGDFLEFETITYCPYDRKGIDVTMLDDSELSWLNDYLALVFEKLSKHLDNDPELLAYLKRQCAPFVR